MSVRIRAVGLKLSRNRTFILPPNRPIDDPDETVDHPAESNGNFKNATEDAFTTDHDPAATVPGSQFGSDLGRALKSASLDNHNRPDSGNRFSILRHHASGGLGKVSIARDHDLQRDVALKEIQSRYADDIGSQNRFLLEAEVTGRLEHPGIVPVYALGKDASGRPYYAMRFIEGESLREAISKFLEADADTTGSSILSQRQLLMRFVSACQAIAYAHSRGVIHRDLKPSNIMLGKFGETLVVDWGLAKVVGRSEQAVSSEYSILERGSTGSGSTQTRMGSVIGTPGYMSPEQASGDPTATGPSADIYSLGATLYQILTGSPPFGPDSIASTLEKIRNGSFPKPRSVQHGIEPALESICLKAMSVSQSDRYPSALELAADLERYLSDEPVAAFAEPTVLRARRWLRKHPRTVVGGCVTALMGLLTFAMLSGVVTSKNRELTGVVNDLRLANQSAVSARDYAETQTAKSRQLLTKMHTTKGLALSQSIDRTQSLAWFGKALEYASESEQAASFYRLDAALARSPRVQGIIAHRGRVDTCEISESGRLVVTGSGDTTANVFDTQTRRVVASLPHEDSVRHVAFIPSSGLAVTASGKKLSVWSISEQALVRVLDHPSEISSLAVSNDGTALLTSARDGSAFCWDSLTGDMRWKRLSSRKRGVSAIHPSAGIAVCLNDETNQFECVSIPSDEALGALLEDDEVVAGVTVAGIQPLGVTIDDSGVVRVWDLPTAKMRCRFDAIANAEIFVSDNGQVVAAVAGETWFDSCEVLVWNDLDGAEPTARRLPHPAYVTSVTIHANAELIVTTATDESVRIFDLASLELRETLFHAGYAMDACLSSDGNQLVITGGVADSGHATIWEMPSAETRKIQPANSVNFAIYSDTGKQIATANNNGIARVFTRNANEVVCELSHSEPVVSVEFLSNDSMLRCVTESGSVVLWDWANQERLMKLEMDGSVVVCSESTKSRPAQYASIKNGKSSTSVLIYTDAASREMHEIQVQAKLFQPVISSSGQWLTATGVTATLRVWKYPFNELAFEMKNPYPVYQVLDAVFDEERSLVACSTGEWTGAGRVQFWSVESGETVGEPFLAPGYVTDIDLSEDGRLLAAASRDHSALIWNRGENPSAVVRLSHDAAVASVQFVHQGERLLTTTGKRVRLWDVSTSELLAEVLTDSTIVQACLSPDETAILIVAENGGATQHSLTTGIVDPAILRQHAELCAGRSINQSGSVSSLSSDELEARVPPELATESSQNETIEN